MHQRRELKCWTRELGVSEPQLQEVVDKVGNSAAAVRKELAHRQISDDASLSPAIVSLIIVSMLSGLKGLRINARSRNEAGIASAA